MPELREALEELAPQRIKQLEDKCFGKARKNCPRCKVELFSDAPERSFDGFDWVCLSCAEYLLREELRIVKEDNLVLKEQVRYWKEYGAEEKVEQLEAVVRYWKWRALGYGAPEFENFEVNE